MILIIHHQGTTNHRIYQVDAASFTAWKAFTGANIGAFPVIRPVFFTRDGPLSQPARGKEKAVLAHPIPPPSDNARQL